MTQGEKRRFPEGSYTTVRYSPAASMWLTVVAQQGQALEAYGHNGRGYAFPMAMQGAQHHGLERIVRRVA